MTGSDVTAATWAVSDADTAAVDSLVARTGLSPLIARLLVNRGVTDAEAARSFLSPSMDSDWRDPERIPGMSAAADAVASAVADGRRIVVFGDFDADGLSAAAVVHRGLAELGIDVDVVIPDRFRDGYGLTPEVLPRVTALHPELVITVDCGISAAKEVAALRDAGTDVVVTDHHEPGEHLPEGVPVADPKLDDAYPFHGLAGAGVALKLVQAVGTRCDRPDLHRGLTDIASLGTVGDIVPLLDENRALVADGLAAMRRSRRPAIAALAEAAGVDLAAIRSDSIAFGLVPRLNAAGRMADPRIAFDLLVTDDPDEAVRIAGELDEMNEARRDAEKDLFEEVVVRAHSQVDAGAAAILVAGEGWHEGVRGIVAARLARRFDMPALVFSLQDGIARGSGRSVPGLDLHAVVAQLSEYLDRFGGHPAAVGATLAAKRLDAFRHDLDAAVAEAPRSVSGPLVEEEIALETIGPELAAEVMMLEPFGQGNPKPLFGTRGVFMQGRKRVGKGGDHLVFDAYDGVASVPAIAFRCPDVETAAEHDAAVDVAYEVEEDEWRGRRRSRMLVRELFRHAEEQGSPAATLVEDLFEAAPAILAREEYAGIGEAESFHTKLAGVTFEDRQEVVASLAEGTPLRLVRQPDNPYDPNACALFAPDGRQVGFFNRRLAAALSPLLDDGLDLDVTITDVTGGEDDRSRGVNVLVERRDIGEADAGEGVERVRSGMTTLDAADLDRVLIRHFIGDGRLHEAQEITLRHLAAGRGCLTVMATGRGKSLIFHLHAVREAIVRGSASVFVYPLRALVSDQAFHLEESLGALGVRCETITGETSPGDRDRIFSGLADGSVGVTLTTPEFLDRHVERFAATKRVGFAVVDEAHHVGLSRSGYRPAYSRLGEMLERLGRPCVLAVTATAGDEVARAIMETLSIGEMVADPSVRENLHIEDHRGGRDKSAYVASLVARGEKVIVYVNSREKSVRIASQLRDKVPSIRHRTAFYNGGVARGARHAVEHAFRRGDLTAIVATSAFGEGVNIPDIRHVVHFHLPFNEVGFNQMSGRAGRDDRPATVHLLYGPRDSRLNELILESVAPDRDDMAQLYLVLRDLQAACEDSFEVTNAELAGEVEEKRPCSKLSERGVSVTLGVFRELGLLEGEGAGSYRRLRLLPHPGKKLDLASSARHAEGVRERETFRAFKKWALEADPSELLARFNRPILPSRYTQESPPEER